MPVSSEKENIEVPPLLQDDVTKAELDYLLQLKRSPVDESVLRILEDKDPEPQNVKKIVSESAPSAPVGQNRDEVYSQTTLNRLPVPTQRPNMPKNAFPIEEHEIPTLED